MLQGFWRDFMQLFEPIIPRDQWHHNFANMIMKPNVYVMDVLTDWARGFVDRDGKFVREFQTTFNPCFWELYLHAVFKHYGLAVDFTHSAPDFVLPGPGISVEAVIASNSVDGRAEFDKEPHDIPREFREFNLRAMIRNANSLTVKNRKFKESYSSLPHVAGRPFVVALSPFDQPFAHMECQRPIEAVLHDYYVDEDSFDFDRPDVRSLEGKSLGTIYKGNGSPIELGFFKREEFADISAVIFSSSATYGKASALSSDPNEATMFYALRSNSRFVRPTLIQKLKPQYNEHLLDGLRIYHNPNARIPLDPSLFRHPLVFQSYWRGTDEIVEEQEGMLLVRWLHSVIATKD
jgi:hypothetical protein